MDTLTQYKSVISDLIQKQMLMLGPNVALAQARRVQGLTVSDTGIVTAIQGDPQQVLSEVAKQYIALSGQITQMTLESLITKYPNIKLNNDLK